MISAIQPECNINRGKTQWRFRPLGVPSTYAKRLNEDPLTLTQLASLKVAGKTVSVLFVYIGAKKFDDGRMGYDPANPATDPLLLDRIDKYWQIGPLVEEWKLDAELSPTLLVAVSGPPQARIIISAVEIDGSQWHKAESDGGLYQVPTKGPKNLDACELRGRRISPEARIVFGSFASQFFIVLDPDGTTRGGGPLLRTK